MYKFKCYLRELIFIFCIWSCLKIPRCYLQNLLIFVKTNLYLKICNWVLGIIDSSGIRFHVSSTLRKMDAGVMELGLEYTDKMVIPPKQPSFSLNGYCVTACTAVVRKTNKYFSCTFT